MTKKEVRKEYLDKRLALSQEERLHLNELLLPNFLHIPFPQINHVMSYIAIAEKAEVVPTAIEIWLKQQHPESSLCYPKTDLNIFSMEAVRHLEGMTLANSELGIAEPVSGDIIDPQTIDVILVPLVAFDRKGHRIGYGKGFYDRFIARCHKDVVTVGLSFFDPVESIDDLSEFDLPLKYCVTPQRLYVF